MATFSKTISTALNYYKGIVRKNYETKDANEHIKQLKLKRRQIQNANDITLYNMAWNVVKHIEGQIATQATNPSWHFGVADFMNYLQNTLNEYKIENNRVVHVGRKASAAILEVIQHIGLPKHQINPQQLDNCIKVVAQYGSTEQHEMLKKVLVKNMDKHVGLLDTLLQRFRHYISKARNSWITV